MKSFHFCLLILAFPCFLWGQSNSHSHPDYEGQIPFFRFFPELDAAVPIGAFGEQMNKSVLIGKGFSVLVPLKNQPISFGLRLGDYSYDHVSRNLGSAVQKNKNKIWNHYGVLRYEPSTRLPIQPYLEGAFGLNRFYSKTYKKPKYTLLFFILAALLGQEDFDDVRFDQSRLHSDFGKCYGGAIGGYWVFDHKYNTALDFQIGLRMASQGSYLVRKSQSGWQVDPIDYFLLREGTMTMLSFKISVSCWAYKD